LAARKAAFLLGAVMDRIDTIISTMIDRWEGGYSHHPADRGGPTKFGITAKTLADYLRRPVTAEAVRALPRSWWSASPKMKGSALIFFAVTKTNSLSVCPDTACAVCLRHVKKSLRHTPSF